MRAGGVPKRSGEIMSNQDDHSGWPSNINQIKWAMRHGQKIDGLEDMVLSNQPVMINENRMDNGIRNNSNSIKMKTVSDH